jgi:SsrA-binding protein
LVTNQNADLPAAARLPQEFPGGSLMAKSSKRKPGKGKAARSAAGRHDPAGNAKRIAENRRARHRYEITEQLECGIMLTGSEVKSLRDGKLSLDEAYVRLDGGELWLVGADIPEYRQATIWNHDPKRRRKLLVHAGQLRKLAARLNEKGLTIVPLRAYFNARGIVKLMIGVGRGKKLHDKRESLKDREVKRQIDRSLRGRR